jgi:hypothetical protein
MVIICLRNAASIVEHGTYSVPYKLSYAFIKQCETIKTRSGI